MINSLNSDAKCLLAMLKTSLIGHNSGLQVSKVKLSVPMLNKIDYN